MDHVFTSVRAAVVRRAHTGDDLGQAQAVTLPQALLLYTSRAAQVARMDRLGRIEEATRGRSWSWTATRSPCRRRRMDQFDIAQTWLRGELAWPR